MLNSIKYPHPINYNFILIKSITIILLFIYIQKRKNNCPLNIVLSDYRGKNITALYKKLVRDTDTPKQLENINWLRGKSRIPSRLRIKF